jgi:predicted small secreted protein
MRWSMIDRMGGRVVECGRRVVIVLVGAAALCACNVVLGIGDVSSANGPDSGQRISGSTGEPPSDAGNPVSDAGNPVSDATAGGQDAPVPSMPEPDASTRGSAGQSAVQPVEPDAALPPQTPASAGDEDAGELEDDAGSLR